MFRLMRTSDRVVHFRFCVDGASEIFVYVNVYFTTCIAGSTYTWYLRGQLFLFVPVLIRVFRLIRPSDQLFHLSFCVEELQSVIFV